MFYVHTCYIFYSFWKMPVDLVNEKIKFWEQKGQESRTKDFERVKDVLQKAMNAASDESLEKVRTNIAIMTIYPVNIFYCW